MTRSVEHLRVHQWKPGQSGNPGGVNNLPEDIREARKFNSIDLERAIHKILGMTFASAEDLAHDDEAPAIEALIASIYVKATKKGDEKRAEWLFARAGMKSKDDALAALQAMFAAMPKEELLAFGHSAMARLMPNPPQGSTIDVNAKDRAAGISPDSGRKR